ncbi:uncharacterized protein B0H18DRAFT_989771 [Fomitopsis serialis]|uniref:uncharacterized protein n=1 Tax=Fomitopsis serialis TaxID=139415 RepID=UPI002008C5A1|nr:uncharacterized protein B0H18DRAFT_989771 [Neoantrodia serialis]KAH9931520.1 hypothetical protein B0H18DRAFT_989771 [Neoantrodia serialis]
MLLGHSFQSALKNILILGRYSGILPLPPVRAYGIHTNMGRLISEHDRFDALTVPFLQQHECDISSFVAKRSCSVAIQDVLGGTQILRGFEILRA